MSISAYDIRKCLLKFSKEARELYINDFIPLIDGPPSVLEFHRDWVSKNLPCIFKNAINHWPAIKNWDLEYLEEKLGHKKVTVAVTPNGLADAVYNDHFVLPEERQMLMKDFLEITKQANLDQVYYIQKQNSNMTEEFKDIMCDIDMELPFASEALNRSPDAINFWMGQGQAVTSLHKDHYENLYCVIRGKKKFTLYPPSDRPFIPYKNYPVAQYLYADKKWTVEGSKIVGNSEKVPWISVDPLNPRYDKFPHFKHAQPLVCTLYPGDILYLPALWFHHVQQTDWAIAVNYWYDMDFDAKYIYFQTLDKLSNLIEQCET